MDDHTGCAITMPATSSVRKVWSLMLPLISCIIVQLPAVVQGRVLIANNSVPTLCAEDDNVNIPLFGDVNEFIIQATHPTYLVTTYDCPPDFSGCPQTVGTDYQFEPASAKLYDDGVWVLMAWREQTFWRPHGMTVKANTQTFVDAHRIAVSKKVAGANSWPQFLVLYADGNLRLIPHPPQGASSVCFGTSVIVGPAEPSPRPFADVNSVEFLPSAKTLSIGYANGDTAMLAMTVDRTMATVSVKPCFSAKCLPFATFRSMFVFPGNCDGAQVKVYCDGKTVDVKNVLDPFACLGDEFRLSRNVLSTHNMSAPDISIRITDPNTADYRCPGVDPIGQ